MTSFGRGLHNRNPAVLVAAALLLVPFLLVIQASFTSGAWTTVPMKYWVRVPTDDFTYVSWTTGTLKRDPTTLPLVVLTGGSSGREAISSGPSLASQVKKAGGPPICAYNLSCRKQRFAQTLAIIDNLPDTPTTVLVGVNLGRFSSTPERNFDQVTGGDLLLDSATLRRYAREKYGAEKYSYTILPGISTYLATLVQRRMSSLQDGQIALPKLLLHQWDQWGLRPRAKLEEAMRNWLRPTGNFAAAAGDEFPDFKKNLAFNLALLDEVVRRGKERGFDIVLVDLPYDRAVIGHSFDAAMAMYKVPCRKIARKYGVPYLDFTSQLKLTIKDYRDLSHLRPSGRKIWEAKLAQELVGLYRSGVIDGGHP